jgi:beta-N-acetylhexosaminidase
MQSTSKKSLPLIVGIKGEILTPEEIEFFRQNPPEGFILFDRNIKSREQVIELNKSLRALNPDRKILLLIDQEGGIVARLKPPIIKNTYPPAEFFGKLYEKSPEVGIEAVRKNFTDIMSDLQELGFDSPCGPVADLKYSGAHKVIGSRSFGSDPAQVIELCNAAIDAIEESGGIAIIKHMPGHGRAIVDSHNALPRVSNSLEELWNSDFAVFQFLSDKVDFAMTAHILFEAIDQDNPITISAKGIEFLRNKIGFKGKILTDALEMGALHGELGKYYLMLKKIKEALDNQKPYNQDLVEELIAKNIIQGGEDLSSAIDKVYKDIHLKFCESLAKKAKEAITAGCDYILHCSGNLEEIKAITNELKKMMQDFWVDSIKSQEKREIISNSK